MEYASLAAVFGELEVTQADTEQAATLAALFADAGATTVGASGWAVEESFRYRGGYDITFFFSDYCDFTELLEVVEAVDPERIYNTHGFAEAVAAHLTGQGYDATALKPN